MPRQEVEFEFPDPNKEKDIEVEVTPVEEPLPELEIEEDRKSTRLNSSHVVISYAVFCLKKKKNII